MAFGRELRRRAKAAGAAAVSRPGRIFRLERHKGRSRDLFAYAARQQLLAQAQDNLVRTQADRTEWERRVAELRSDHLDPDLLDERARAMLNLADLSDIIVPAGDKDRLY